MEKIENIFYKELLTNMIIHILGDNKYYSYLELWSFSEGIFTIKIYRRKPTILNNGEEKEEIKKYLEKYETYFVFGLEYGKIQEIEGYTTHTFLIKARKK